MLPHFKEWTRLLFATALCCSTLGALAEAPTSDFREPIRASQDTYPPKSKDRHEEELCIVKFMVTAEGNVEDATLNRGLR